jgi:hypothetical protein
MNITTSYYSASGQSLDSCYYIGNRYNDDWGYRPLEAECWIISHHALPKDQVGMTTHLGTTAFLTNLWTSPSGALFVCNVTDSKIAHRTSPLGTVAKQFEETQFATSISRVWGLHDQLVFAWGTTWQGRTHMYRYNGVEWLEIPAPKFPVYSMHGRDEGSLYAVGKGGAATWNGKKWSYLKVQETLTSVFTTAKNEVYSTTAQGNFLKLSGKEWLAAIKESSPFFPFLDVAEWQGEIFVAGGVRGLFRYEQKKAKMTCVKDNLFATNLDSRGDLLITCKNEIASTANGKDFYSAGDDYLFDSRKRKLLGDLE